MIRVENVIFEYPGKRALDNVSFNVESGSITALVGPNGAGKSTLMRSIAALDDVFSGSIFVDGVDVSEDPRKVHRNIGYLSDFFGLYDDLTVRQCLSYIARAHRISSEELDGKIDLAINRLGLQQYVNARAGTLSRGWRQRLGMAQAIIHEPKLLILDEPASGLDPEARQDLSGLFLKLRDEGMTLMVSSHILAELEDYCTNMLLLRDGKIVDHSMSKGSISPTGEIQMVIGFMKPAEGFVKQLSAFSHLKDVAAKENIIYCTFTGTDSDRQQILKSIVTMGLPVISFSTHEKRLQDIYMDIALKGGSQNAN